MTVTIFPAFHVPDALQRHFLSFGSFPLWRAFPAVPASVNKIGIGFFHHFLLPNTRFLTYTRLFSSTCLVSMAVGTHFP